MTCERIVRDLCQTEKYAQFRKKHGWNYEWRRGNLFFLRRSFGLTIERCYFPSKSVLPSDFRGNYCQVESCDRRLPDPFVCNWTHTVRIALDRDIEEIWTGLRKHARNAIRQARNRGTWLTEGEADDFEVFWTMYQQGAVRHGFKVVKSEILLDYLKTDFCKMFLVGIGDCTIGAYLVLEGEGVARYFCGGFSYKHQHFRPNNLAHWNILEHYQKKGFSTYDMGTCPADQRYALHSFKTDFGKPVITWNCRRVNRLVGKAISLYRYFNDSRNKGHVTTGIPHS